MGAIVPVLLAARFWLHLALQLLPLLLLLLHAVLLILLALPIAWL